MVVDGGQSAMLKVAPAGRRGPSIGGWRDSLLHHTPADFLFSSNMPSPPPESNTFSSSRASSKHVFAFTSSSLFGSLFVLDMLRFSRRPNSSLEKNGITKFSTIRYSSEKWFEKVKVYYSEFFSIVCEFNFSLCEFLGFVHIVPQCFLHIPETIKIQIQIQLWLTASNLVQNLIKVQIWVS